jgi:tRNA modification GTPase
MLERIDDTIVAVSSSAGPGPVGIVRLSGPQAIAIAEGFVLIGGRTLAGGEAFSRLVGEVAPGGTSARFPAFVYVFRAPHSYTRQDVVEIYTIGAPPVLDRIRQACITAGARAAEPGEFTARAFFNGAMDLAAAEAVAGVVRAQSDAQLRASRGLMDGALGRRITAIRDELAELLALVEADIDFAEEPIEFITPTNLATRLRSVMGRIEAMLTAGPPLERLNRLPHILLLGPPNAGKSTLMNALSGTPRAICAAAAGTTRDILAAPIRIGLGEAILLDSAGVDETEDEIIAQARELTLSAAQRVDLVCIVLDATTLAAADPSVGRFISRVRALELPPAIAVVNKCDLLTGPERSQARAALARVVRGEWPASGEEGAARSGPTPRSPLRTRHWALTTHHSLVSAITGEGLDELRDRLWERIGPSETTTAAEAAFMTERQRSAACDALAALRHAAELAGAATETIDCADLLAFELREALDALGAVTGAVTTEDLLGHVFANFCIGK